MMFWHVTFMDVYRHCGGGRLSNYRDYFARLYRRASAEQAFVRTGLGGQKVVMSGGAIVMPIFHEIIPINMNTLKLEVSRSTVDSLITKDRMRVDVVVAFSCV